MTSRRRTAFLRECAVWLVVALVASWVLRTFLVQVFYIPSESMEQTLDIGDRVAVSLLAPGPFDLHRGDIVVFADPGGWLSEQQPEVGGNSVVNGVRDTLSTLIGVNDKGNHLIKRIIGLPGDTVTCCTSDGLVSVNGVPITEPYLNPAETPNPNPFTAIVPDGHVWVMGDNRNHSFDSRGHQEYEPSGAKDPTTGSVPIDDIVGVAFVIVWPLGDAGLLRNPGATFANVPDPPTDGSSP